MSVLRLPSDLRPRNTYYRQCDLGVDLPANFMSNLRGLDENLYPVFHRRRLLWDSMINDYSGSIEDPRYQIEYKHGELNFGFVLTDGKGRPIDDGHWHIWRLCRPYGWAHIIKLESKDAQYLDLAVKQLWLQDKFNSKYGHRGWTRYLESLDIEARQKKMDEQQDLMNEINKANRAMISRAMDNFNRDVTAPTNPEKETIFSGAGISHRSKLIRPATDREGGLILPPGYGEN